VSAPAKMDLRKEIINFFQKEGMLIQPEAVEFLLNKGIDFCKKVLKDMDEKPLIISIDLLEKILGEEKEKKIDRKIEKKIKIEKKGFKILKDITGKSTCEGKLKDFMNLFIDRFEKLGELLKKRQEMRNAVPIRKAQKLNEEISIIGIVKDVRNAKNGLIVEIEDYEDFVSVYIPKEVDSVIVNDEVIGVVGKRKNDLIIAKNVVRPEIPIERERRFSEEEKYVAFISDLHVGSKSFLNNKWQKFIEWINGKRGNERQRQVAKKIEYLVISGDDVEGVGIYPGQEEDLEIEDIYIQYEELAKKIGEISSEIKIIIQPGNHDAVRPALPQPAFEKEIRDLFDSNIIFVGNPCYFEIDGVIILSYHGQSIQDFATCIPNMSQNVPTKIMREMLRRRHMAPIYGGISSLAPEKKDYLVIDIIPDIFVTGHVHVTSIEFYRNVLLLNASAWQSQTNYQKTMNFMPDPAKAIVVNLKNMAASIMQF